MFRHHFSVRVTQLLDHMARLRSGSRRTRTLPVRQVLQLQSQQDSKVDIHSPYQLRQEQIRCYRESGFVRLPNVFDAATLAHYSPSVSLGVANADKTPLEEDSDYQKAFTQVLLLCVECLKAQILLLLHLDLLGNPAAFNHPYVLQITNLWTKSKPVEEFVLGQKLGRIASQLMGVRLTITRHCTAFLRCESTRARRGQPAV